MGLADAPGAAPPGQALERLVEPFGSGGARREGE